MRRVRLPLHIGVDALWYAAGVSALLLPGAVLIAAKIYLESIHEDGGSWGWIGAVLVLVSFALAYLAWSARASDAIFEPDGIAIDGGKHSGARLRWEEMASVTLQADELNVLFRIDLVNRAGQKITIAEAVDEAEVASLRSLHETLQAKLSEAPEALPRRADLACCSACGAPLPPTDAPSIQCISCGATNQVDPRLRERVAMQRAADRSMSATAVAIEKLLDQPGAAAASASLIVAGVISALVWATVAIGLKLQTLQAIDAFTIGVGFFNGWAFTFAAFGFARITLARRRALLILSTTFGARPPMRRGEAPGCRQCGAPLPTDQGVLARCAYCDAQSVLGINVTPLLHKVQDQGNSIEKVLQGQAAERWSWIRLGIAAMGAAALGSLFLLMQVEVARGFAEDQKKCESGDAEACASVGLSYSTGAAIREDKALAFHYRKLACDRDHAEACSDMAFQLALGIGVERDRAAAKEKYEKACRLGFAKACEEVKELDQ